MPRVNQLDHPLMIKSGTLKQIWFVLNKQTINKKGLPYHLDDYLQCKMNGFLLRLLYYVFQSVLNCRAKRAAAVHHESPCRSC